MKAMILAAGLGTRLRPVTKDIPKALAQVDGKSLLSIVMERLKKAGFSDFVINTHYFAEKIADYLHKNNDPDCRIQISHEAELLLETGGGIKRARPLLEGDGRFLIHNVDILSNLNIPEFIANAPKDALATLALCERDSSRYLLFDDNMRLLGWTDAASGRIRSPYKGLNPDKCRKYSFTGIHLLSDRIFPVMEDWGEVFSIIDLYLAVAAEYPVYGYLQKDIRMLDAGKPETLAAAAEFLRSLD